MKILNIGLAVILVVLGFFAWLQLSKVENVSLTEEVVYEKVNPEDKFAFLRKRLGEKLKLLLLSPSPSLKEDYYEELANRRLTELRYIVQTEDWDNIERASERYFTAIGMWVDFILNKDLKEGKATAYALLDLHLSVLEELMGQLDDTTAQWRFVKQDFDYVQIYLSKLQ